MALLSASMDRSMAIWRPDPETGVWLNDVRVGELGGNALGFFGGLFGPEGLYILAHGYNGAFHLWKRQVTKVLQGRSCVSCVVCRVSCVMCVVCRVSCVCCVCRVVC